MNPAKNRERKCSTCKHYQPSPLWRKGWCRNPLLYDRNTNHLVEADSLSCNRTFIDYWEPMTGPAPTAGPQGRGKPRIAPSIPMNTMDAQGRRISTAGNTPVGGMAAVAPKREPAPVPSRQPPQLAIVTPDYDEGIEALEDDPKATQRRAQIEGPGAEAQPATAAQRIRQARNQNRSRILVLGPRLWVPLAVVLLLALGGGYYMMKNKSGTVAPLVTSKLTATVPAPTPTGLGDATPTSVTPPTTAPPPANVIAVNGWVQVANAGNGLTLRGTPAKSGARITLMPNGTKARVADGPKQADGYTWWKVDSFSSKDPTKSGWCAADFLTPIPKPGP